MASLHRRRRRFSRLARVWLEGAARLGGLVLLAVVGGLVLPAVGGCPAAAQSYSEVTIRAYDAASEQPVYQAEVRLAIFGRGAFVRRAFTDGTGSVHFSGLERNNHVVTISHADYATAEEVIDVVRTTSQVFSFALTRRPSENGPAAYPNGTVDAARLAIPPAARKQYESGLKLLDRNPARAEAHFRRAIELHPAYADARALLGQAIWRQVAAAAGSQDPSRHPRAAEAEQALISALELDPDLRLALILLGRIFIETRQFARAEAVLLESHRLDPAAWDAPFELARCYFNLGRLEPALRFARRAQAAEGAPTSTRLLVADVLLRNPSPAARAEALAELLAFLEQDPRSPYAPRVRQAVERLRP